MTRDHDSYDKSRGFSFCIISLVDAQDAWRNITEGGYTSPSRSRSRENRDSSRKRRDAVTEEQRDASNE